MDALDVGVCDRPGPVGKDQRELLAADAIGRLGAERLAQDLGHLLENAVADRVPVAVVDALEVVEVDDRERDGAAGRRGERERLAQVGLERAVVPERGQGVGLCVTHRQHGPVGVALIEGECEERPGEQDLERRVHLPQRHGER